MDKKNLNKNLCNARKNKNDEFYTQLSDIETELQHYKKQLYGKVIYCNCDDPLNSNFFNYFYKNFEELGLKKLIVSCYNKDGMGTYLEYYGEDYESKT